jgi:histidinol-phosphate aminotransferase
LADPATALGLIKPAVRALAAYTLDAPPADRKLNQNEAPDDLPADLKQEILARAARAPWHRYPGFTPHRLSELIAARHGWSAEGVLVGNGSNEVIQAALAVTVGQDDVVVAPEPTFSLYRLLTGVYGGRYVPVPLGPDFGFDVGRIIETARREGARVVVLNSPNNPTGSALADGAVERVLAGTDGLVFCDEAYQEFGGPSALELADRDARVIVFRTFSKAMGMAALRFGYALAHPAVAREIAKGKLPYNVNAITLAAAEVALGQPERFAARVREIIAERERLIARLAALPGVEAFPSAANFVLLRFATVPAETVFRRLIEEHRILIRDVSRGTGLQQCLRVTVGTPEDNTAVVQALRDIVT